jgi:hypothetical protein
MTRKELNDKIEANHEAIKKLRLENIELQKQEMLLSDDVQQYYEEEVEVVVKRRPKIVEKQHRGIITWKEDFKDEDTGEVVTIQRHQVVRINGEWV